MQPASGVKGTAARGAALRLYIHTHYPPSSLKLKRVRLQHQAFKPGNFPILQILPGSRGSKDWRLQGPIPRSKDPSSRHPSSKDREKLRFYREALGALSPPRIGDRRRPSDRFGKTFSQPTILKDGFHDSRDFGIKQVAIRVGGLYIIHLDAESRDLSN